MRKSKNLTKRRKHGRRDTTAPPKMQTFTASMPTHFILLPLNIRKATCTPHCFRKLPILSERRAARGPLSKGPETNERANLDPCSSRGNLGLIDLSP